jgi:predicted transcriptional regulator
VLFAVGLYIVDGKNGQPEETAERILQFIQDIPGCYLRKIKEKVHVSQGIVQYHTDRLEKMGRITSTRSGLYTLLPCWSVPKQ